MLQSPSHTLETRASWVVASAALFAMMMSFGAAWITAVALKDIAAEVGGARSIPALREFARLARLRRRRHPDGPDRRPRGHALDGDGRRADDRARAFDLDLRTALAAVDRARAVHRPARDRRHQCAALHLCQPLVRPPARLGAGADLQRHLSRRRAVAADLRACHRRDGLARHHAVVRAGRSGGDRAARRHLFSSSARGDRAGDGGERQASTSGACSAGRPIWCSR